MPHAGAGSFVPQAGAGSVVPQAGAPTTSLRLFMSVSFFFATPPSRASIMHFQETRAAAEEGTNLLGTHLLVSTPFASAKDANACWHTTRASARPRICQARSNAEPPGRPTRQRKPAGLARQRSNQHQHAGRPRDMLAGQRMRARSARMTTPSRAAGTA